MKLQKANFLLKHKAKANLGNLAKMNYQEFKILFPNYLALIHQEMKKDPFYNQLHLSPGSGLMNDPNGLVEYQKTKHIFYQWVPYQPHHYQKHWGHYQTIDFINYQFSGVAIEPSLFAEKDGAFSGGALLYNKKIYLFWTGNVEKSINYSNDIDAKREAYTLMGIWDSINNKILNKKVLFKVDSNYYTGHFRDPMPFMMNNCFYLLHGAQNHHHQGTFALYEGKNIDGPFLHLGSLSWKVPLANDAYMYECPNLVKINNQLYLIFSTQGAIFFKDNQNRDNCLMIKVSFDLTKKEIINQGEPFFLDYGFDFYAPQTMKLSDGRTILFAWGGVSDSEPIPTLKNGWAHCLTIPRELTIKNNILYQKPIQEYQKLRASPIYLKANTWLATRQVELLIKKLPANFYLILKNEDNQKIKISYSQGELIIDKGKMSYYQTEKYGNLRRKKIKLSELQIILDNSFLELYANDGTFCFAMKYWLVGKLLLKLSKNLLSKITGYYLNPLNIDWGDFYDKN